MRLNDRVSNNAPLDKGVSIILIADGRTKKQALDLLAEGFETVPRRIWVKALDANPAQGSSGFLLIENGVAHGVLLTFEHTRKISGTIRRFINLSAWYVQPSHRAYSFCIFRAAIAEKDVIYICATPSLTPVKIALANGFRTISDGSILSVPMLNGLGVGLGIWVETYKTTTTCNIDTRVRKWLDDHDDERHLIVLVSGLGATFPAVLRQVRDRRGLRYARLSYVENHELMRAALPTLHWHLLIRKGIIGIQLPCFAPYRDLRVVVPTARGPSILVKGDIPDADIDLLYTEMLFVPSWRM